MIIFSFEGEQLLVGALLDDASVVEDDDLVGIADGGEAVGNDESGAPLHDAVHAALDELLGTGVDGGGCLVEDKDGWVGNGSTGNSQ